MHACHIHLCMYVCVCVCMHACVCLLECVTVFHGGNQIVCVVYVVIRGISC